MLLCTGAWPEKVKIVCVDLMKRNINFYMPYCVRDRKMCEVHCKLISYFGGYTFQKFFKIASKFDNILFLYNIGLKELCSIDA